MKRNLVKGIILISAAVLSSCSVSKQSSTKNNDDVYFSKATAAEQPEYAVQPKPSYRQDADDQYSDDDDYYYYDDYASRINRFSYFSTFGYYDYAYSPYYGGGFGLGYGGYYSPFGYGLGFGYGYGGLSYGFGGYYGFGGFGYGVGYGYGYGYSPYSYWGTGYGGGGYWGPVSANNTYGPRPNRGNGSPGSSIGVPRTSYGGRAAGVGSAGYYSGRPNRVGGASSVGRPGSYGSTGSARPARNIREDRPQVDRPRPQIERAPQPSYSPSPSSSGGGGGSSGGGGGGGRPVRP